MKDRKKTKETLKMSEHTENASTGLPSRESEKADCSPSPTTSLITETAKKIVSETLEWALANIGEQISRSEAQKSCDSDGTNEKCERRHGSKIYKKMKSVWKYCFRWKPRKKVQHGSSQVLPGAEDVHVDEIIGSESSNLTSSCEFPKEMSTTTSVGSNENIMAAEKADLLVTGMDATHRPSLVLPGAEDNCKTVLTVNTQKSCGSDRTNEKSAGRHGRKIYKKMISVWKSCFRREPKKKLQLAAEHNLDEAASSDQTSDHVSPTKMSLSASVGSSEGITAVVKGDVSSVPLEDVTEEGVMEDNTNASPGPSLDAWDAMSADLSSTTMELVEVEYKKVSKPSTTSSSPPAEHLGERSSVTDLTIYRDSTPGPSRSQDDNGAAGVAQITGPKNILYNIIKEFFDSLTKEQKEEISKGVWNLDVKERLTDMCTEVLKLTMENIVGVLSQAISPSAHPHNALTTKSPASSQECGAEVAGQKLLLEILREEDNISQSLKCSLCQAFCDVVCADTPISISPKVTEATVRVITNEVSSVLSKSVEVSLCEGSSNGQAATCCQFSSCRTCKEILERVIWAINTFLTSLRKAMQKTNQTVKVHKKKSPWWSFFHRCRKNMVHPLSVDEASSPQATTCSVPPSKVNSIPLELDDYVEDEDTTSEATENTPSLIPPACAEDEVPDYRESPLVIETQETKMRSSSQSGDSANKNCKTDVENTVMAVSDTDVDNIQAEKSSGLCRIFRKGKKKEDKAPTQQTKRPSLLKRIRLFCCRLTCSSHNDGA